MAFSPEAPQELLIAEARMYAPCGFTIANFVREAESADYSACTFELNNLSVKFRTAKITPTKTGQFVTLWKRQLNGIIAPYEDTDAIDLFIVSTCKEQRLGYFIFPKAALCKWGVLSTAGKEGKRAIRVYPLWDEATNKQAQKSQRWQSGFFIEIREYEAVDTERLRLLHKSNGGL